MNFKAVPIGKVSVGDEIRQKSDEELATFIEIVSRCGRCQWCIHKRNCYRSDDKKCAQGVKAFLGKTVLYEGRAKSEQCMRTDSCKNCPFSCCCQCIDYSHETRPDNWFREVV